MELAARREEQLAVDVFSLIDLIRAIYALLIRDPIVDTLPIRISLFGRLYGRNVRQGGKIKKKRKKGEERKKLKKKKKPKFQRIVIGSKLEPHSSSTPSSLFIPYREMSFGMRNMKENVYGIRVYMDDK